MRCLALFAALACCSSILLLSSCGGTGQRIADPLAADVTSLSRPAGVDPALWDRLTAALSAVIRDQAGVRRASNVPNIPQSKVTDFALGAMDAEGAHFSWTFKSQGDYDQNGEVNVADLSPLGLNFGKLSTDADWAKAEPVDGNADGAITIADVTPIGINLRIRLDGYVIQQSSTPADEGSWVDVLDVPLDQGSVPPAGGFRQYSVVVPSPVGNSDYRVAPYEGTAPAREYGIPSDPVMTADFQPPVNVLATAGDFADKVVVSWDAAADATGYEVYRDVQDTPVGTTDAATLSWDDTGVSDFAPHTYWVKAVYASGTSPVSAEAIGFRAQHGDWWMFGHDLRHSHRSSYVGPQNSGLLWARRVAGEAFSGSSPAIGSDGTLYIGGATNPRLYAFNPDGSDKWSFSTDEVIGSSPAVGVDGVIYVSTGNFAGSMYAVTPAGAQKWTYPLPFGALSSPAVAKDGHCYVGGLDGILYAFNPNGTLDWGKPLTSATSIFGSPALGANGNIYVADTDGILWAIDSEGNEVWQFDTASSVYGSPAFSDDGLVVYLGDINGVLHAVNTGSGKERWSYPTGAGFFGCPAIAADGSVFHSDFDGTVWKINPNGTLGMSIPVSPGAGLTDVTIGADGLLYVGSSAANVLALDPNTGAVVWQRRTESEATTNPSLGPGGELYAPTFGGFLLAFGPASASPPATPTGLTATQGSLYQKIKLSWDFAYDAEGYEIYKDGGATPVATVGNVNSWTDAPVADSQVHTYKLKATNANGASPLTAAVSGSASNNAPGPGDWGMYGHDAARTRLSTLTGPAVQPAFWSFQTMGEIYSSPTVGSNGEVYMGSDDGSLYCLNSDGSLRWQKPMGSPVESSVAIGSDGTLYFGTGSGTLYALNPDNSEKWKYPTGANIYSSPAIENGLIYFGNTNGDLFALNPDGTLAWSINVGQIIISSPAIGSDGTVYVGNGEDNELVAVKPDGSDLAWSFPCNGAVRATPAVKRDAINGDRIYVGSFGNRMYCIKADGTQDWFYDATDLIFSSAAIGADGAIYFGSKDGLVYALDPDGSFRWSIDMFAPVYSSPAVGSDGRVFVGDSGGFINAITPAGQFDWYLVTTGSVMDSSPAIGPGGMVYLADTAGKIYGFGP